MNTDTRKGELTELKNQLRQLAGSRAVGVGDVKRELYKKVISYMTIGIDVSALFSEMVMCSATSDLVLKKMCYLYVCNYAAMNPELALLTINFLQRDCQDDDPMIRGLALRSLCGLRVKNLVEYLVGPIRQGLKDKSPYVRMTASIGVLKLYHIAPAVCKENEFTETLKSLLIHDPDAQVVANSLCALEEILTVEVNQNNETAIKEKEVLYSKAVVFALLNRIKEFSEWGQCLVLDLVSKYVPTEANETFDIMNLLEDRLQHANSALVLATTKVFLHLTLSMADVHQQVYERIKAPLLTLMSSSSSEQSYAVLSHLSLLVSRAPMLFAADYKHFFCRFSDPTYVKKLKLEMLTAVANENNTFEIVTELSEYAANVDVTIARESIRAVGQIALQSYDVNGIVDRLLQFLEMDTDYVTAETLVLVKDLLRKYPQWSQDCIAVVGSVSTKSVQEPRAKAALVWMLGEYGQEMADAPYVLENLVEGWAEEESPTVKLEILTAIAKLFFKRPPECQSILGTALNFGLADHHQDVHDRALLYYRLLQAGVEAAERVINPPKQAVSVFAETQSSEAKDRIFDEFNSLAVVYRKPSYLFLDKEHRGPLDVMDPEAMTVPAALPSPSGVAPTGAPYSEADTLLSAEEKEETLPPVGVEPNISPSVQEIPTFDLLSPAPSLPPASTPVTASVPAVTASAMTSLDDLFGFTSSSLSQPEVPEVPTLKLNPRPVLDAETFRRKWSQFPLIQTLDETLSTQASAALLGPQPLLKHMASRNIQCMASGGTSPNFKFFFYAQKAGSPPGNGVFLVELLVNKAAGTAVAKVKVEEVNLASGFVEEFKAALSSFGSL